MFICECTNPGCGGVHQRDAVRFESRELPTEPRHCANCKGLLAPMTDERIRHFDGSYYCVDNRTHAELASLEELTDAEVEEVQRRMDAVVDAAVAWHQSEGEWSQTAEILGDAIDSLLKLRSAKPSTVLTPGTQV